MRSLLDTFDRLRWTAHSSFCLSRIAPTRHDGGLVGEDSDDLRAPLDLAVQAFDRICAVQLGAVGGGEAHMGERVTLGFVHQRGEFRQLGAQLIGDLAPLAFCSFGVVLRKGGRPARYVARRRRRCRRFNGAKPTSPRGRPSKIASFSARTHDAARAKILQTITQNAIVF